MMLRPILALSVVLVLCTSVTHYAEGSDFRLQSLLSFPSATENSQITNTLISFESVDDDQGGRTGVDRNHLQLRHQLQVEARQRVDLIAQYQVLELRSDAEFDATRVTIPEHWHDLGVGLRAHQKKGDRLVSGWIMAGSAADKPFDSAEELYLKATGVLRDPTDSGAAMIYLASLDTDREYPLIPGIAYEFAINPEHHLAIGLPVLEYWGTFWQNTQLAFSYTPLRNTELLLRHRLTPSLTPYLSLRREERYFNRAARDQSDDKVVFYDNPLAVGLTYQATEQVDVDLAYGTTYSFRRIGEGDDDDARKANDVDLDDAEFISFRLNLRY